MYICTPAILTIDGIDTVSMATKRYEFLAGAQRWPPNVMNPQALTMTSPGARCFTISSCFGRTSLGSVATLRCEAKVSGRSRRCFMYSGGRGGSQPRDP